MSLRLHKLTLSNFRNHGALRLEPAGAPMVVLTGPNGAGKTNVLEAVSLLSPGRGLRGAELAELAGFSEPDTPWAVAADVETSDGHRLRLGTGPGRGSTRRVARADGKDLKSTSALAALVSAVWLTPQMDRLFLEGAAARRRFLDRLVYALDPAHAARVAAADKAVRERLALLQSPRPDPAWLDALEARLAEDFAAVGAARLDLCARLEGPLRLLRERESLFPSPVLSVEGPVEKILRQDQPALAAEEEIRSALRANRTADAAAGRTALGTHRADMRVEFAGRGVEASLCSTGEQKGLLISLVLAHALMMRAEKGFVPLLLLDEVAAHLDADRLAQLFSFLRENGGQVWMTGTDARDFSAVHAHAASWTLSDGRFVAV